MSRFVVLLRGVNVGKANRIAMTEFKALLEAEGFTGVRTLLNSGNAVFDSKGRSAAAHAKTIHSALIARLDIDVRVLVKSAQEFAAAIAENPIVPGADEHSRFLVAFAQEADALQDLAMLAALVQPPERFAIGAHAAYLHCAVGILESKVAGAMVGKAGKRVTTRNWATVLKLQALLAAA